MRYGKLMLVLCFAVCATLLGKAALKTLLQVVYADDRIVLGGQQDYMLVHTSGDEVVLEDVSAHTKGQFLALTGTLAGTCKESGTGVRIDGALFSSTGIGATISVNGNYMLSEIPGSWTCSVSHADYKSTSFGFTIDSADDYVVKNVTMTCKDADNDGICNYEDTCSNVDNGPDQGVCVCSDYSANGRDCTSDRDCATCLNPQGFCSMSNDDCDNDGVGDACDELCLSSAPVCCSACYW